MHASSLAVNEGRRFTKVKVGSTLDLPDLGGIATPVCQCLDRRFVYIVSLFPSSVNSPRHLKSI